MGHPGFAPFRLTRRARRPRIDIVQSKTSLSTAIAEPTPDTECNRRGPDWEQIPFDVACARCGADLRGLTDPVCPTCALRFDWDEAIPLDHLICEHCGYHLRGLTETRCPECGEGFTWEEVLDRHHRRKKKLFEYRWRERPVRSAVRTWWWCVWPPRLWREIDIHDPPQRGPLIGWVVLSLFVFYVAFVILFAVSGWGLGYYWSTRGVPSQQLGIGYLMWYLLDAVTDWQVYMVVLTAAVWIVCCLAALMVFRQSMRRCKVRGGHVLRVWAYATAPLFPLVATVVVALERAKMVRWVDRSLPTDPAVLLAILAHATWSFWWGYRIYLRMPHSFAVAVSAQLIAVLGAVSICDVVVPGEFAASLICSICELFGGL